MPIGMLEIQEGPITGTRTKLPVSLQIVGKWFREEQIYQAAYARGLVYDWNIHEHLKSRGWYLNTSMSLIFSIELILWLMNFNSILAHFRIQMPRGWPLCIRLTH